MLDIVIKRSPYHTPSRNSQEKKAHLRKEPVDVDRFDLAKAIHPEDTLDVVRGIPGGIKNDDPVGGHQVDAERTGSGGYKKQTPPE